MRGVGGNHFPQKKENKQMKLTCAFTLSQKQIDLELIIL